MDGKEGEKVQSRTAAGINGSPFFFREHAHKKGGNRGTRASLEKQKCNLRIYYLVPPRDQEAYAAGAVGAGGVPPAVLVLAAPF